MPDYKDKTDLWLLHEYLWVDHNGKRVNEIYNLVRKELQSRGYAINPYGHITGFRMSELFEIIPEYESIPYKCLYCNMISRGIHRVGEPIKPYINCSHCGKDSKAQ